jgi:hypothetical protein
VAEEELPDLARKVRRDLFSVRRSSHTATSLFVLAINCMYYHHDEHGFWAHFCALMDEPNAAPSQTWLGNILESQLLDFNFLAEPGYGPFRYVTPIREQCGITRTEIPRFAELLSWMADRYGWDGIRLLTQEQLADFTSDHLQSGHLFRFLSSRQGHAFVRDVARNVSQFQRRVLAIGELTTLTGYRTGFFDELFEALGRKPSPSSKSVNRPPLPRLLYLPEFRQVGLCFEPVATMRGAFRFGGEVVRQNRLLWECSEDYQTKITGARRDSDCNWSEWFIPGWDPTDGQVALFHVDRGYVDHKDGIQPGEYFMLGHYQAPPPDEVRRGDYGMVDLPFSEVELDAWRIVITETSDLSFLGIEEDPEILPIDLIAWSDTHSRLPGTLESTLVCTDSLPSLEVRRPELFTSNAVALFIDDGEKTRRLHIEPRGNVVYLDVQTPSQGRVWVEPISRLREFAGRDTLCELQYCLFPECQIQWPSGLYAIKEQPEVSLNACATGLLSLDLENATALDEARRHWRVDSGITVLQGQIRAGHFTVPIARRVYHASLRVQHHRLAAYMLPEDPKTATAWILTGVPHENAALTITDGLVSLPLGTLGVFNDAGECRFPATAIRDTLSQWKSPVGAIAVEHHGRSVPTSTLYIDCPKLIQWISVTDDGAEPSWVEFLHNPVRQMFDTSRDVRATLRRQVAVHESIYELPEALQSFFWTVRACAAVFDDALFPESPNSLPEHVATAHSEVSEEASQLLLWYLKASAFVRAAETAHGITAENLLTEYENLSWSPPFQRWQKALTEALAHIRADDEAIPLIEEWKRDVDSGFRSSYSSRISHQHGGQQLTEAWIEYAQFANYQSAINTATPLKTQTGSPVADLAGMLLVLCCMRKALFDSQPPVNLQSSNRKLCAAFNDMKTLAEIGASQRFAMRPTLTVLSNFAPFLPFRSEDSGLIATVKGGREDTGDATDWLTCYYRRRLFDCGHTEQEPAEPPDLADVIKRVPPSPERSRVIDTLKR